MVQIKSNANFYSLAGISVHENQGPQYRQYRKCWKEIPEKFILRDFPMHLDIESTSCCNLECSFCDKLPWLKKEHLGYIDLDLFKRIIDQGAEHNLWGVKLSYRGEPLLHRDIAEMAAYAKKKGVLDVYFNTNGMLLDGKMSEKLIAAGLNRISISIEDIDPLVFEKKRKGAKFQTILDNIENLLEIRKKNKVDFPKVRVQTIYLPEVNLKEYEDFWKGKCDEIAAIDYKDAKNRQKGITCDWACPQLWQRLTIDCQGNIFACNNDDLGLMLLGNAREKTIRQCWHSKKVQAIRKLHREGKSDKISACDGCPWRTAQIKKEQALGKS